MENTNPVNLFSQFLEWQRAFLKITTGIGLAFLIIGAADLLYVRGTSWRPDDLPALLELSFGGFVGFYFIAVVLSGIYYISRAIRKRLSGNVRP